MNNSIDTLRWKKYPVLNDGFICLVDVMGDDSSIVQAARVSYGKDTRVHETTAVRLGKESFACLDGGEPEVQHAYGNAKREIAGKDRALIRYLLNHGHTTPFEMVELKFLVRVPMDCWRQWIRHRTASVNEYSTRYTEAIDSQQTTAPDEWRLQATDNKQGSSGLLTTWPDNVSNIIEFPEDNDTDMSPGEFCTDQEKQLHAVSRQLYEERISLGIAKEQARKDLPLSTYTEAYWKCDLHNVFNFLRLRMDSHAQLEIRFYANAMFEIVKQVCPIACEAFEDYVLNAKKFNRMELETLKSGNYDFKPSSMTEREWKEFLSKLQ